MRKLNVHLLELILCIVLNCRINLIHPFSFVPEWPYWLLNFEKFAFFSKKYNKMLNLRFWDFKPIFSRKYFLLVAIFSISIRLSFWVYNCILTCFIRFSFFSMFGNKSIGNLVNQKGDSQTIFPNKSCLNEWFTLKCLSGLILEVKRTALMRNSEDLQNFGEKAMWNKVLASKCGLL